MKTISEAGELLGVSLDTIRRWEKKGLIKGYRSANGHRLFDPIELSKIIEKSSGHGDVGYQILKRNQQSGFSAVELFAGAGGLALGLKNAGVKCRLLVEIDKHAAATLRSNLSNTEIIQDDVANVSFEGVKADILAGGFPCQAFSYAGKRLGFADTRGTLFFEFARAIKEIKPKVVIGENVKGLERHDGGRTLKTMLAVLDELGYEARYRVLRAQYLDVPQKRERLVIFAVHRNSGLNIAFPKEKNYIISLREALRDVPHSEGQVYSKTKRAVMEMIPEAGYWKDLPLDLQRSYMGASFNLGGGKTGMARRLSWDEPSLTLTCNPAQKQTERCHPSETRPLTVREYARIQSFPDDWKFEGSVSQQYKQIGNAVPVNLGYHIGRAAIAMLENRFDDTLDLMEAKLF